MKAHIAAIRALVESTVTTYYVDVPETPSYPYVLLWSTAGQPGSEPSLTGTADVEDLVGVTVADTTPLNALVTVATVRGLLDGATPTVVGRSVRLRLRYSESVQVDRDVTLPDTNRHPAYVVDRYQMDSTPAPVILPGD